MNLDAGYPDLVVAGKRLTTAGLIMLYGKTNGANLHCTGRKANGTAGYAVTAGKTLTIVAVEYNVIAANTADNLILGYSDNDISPNSASAFTNFVYLGGGSGECSTFDVSVVTGVNPNKQVVCDFQVPAGKYPGIITGGTPGVRFMLYCYEA